MHARCNTDFLPSCEPALPHPDDFDIVVQTWSN
jgi:hypothetical protein